MNATGPRHSPTVSTGWFRRPVSVVPLAILIGFALACRDATPEKPAARQRKTTHADAAPPGAVRAEQAARFAESCNMFGLDLYKKLAPATPGNLAISPASLGIAAAMAAAGARGNTREELVRALHLSGVPDEAIASAGALLLSLNAINRDRTALRVARDLFVERSYKAEPAFLALMRGQFGASVAPVDFKVNPDQSRRIINARVAQQTEQHITEILPKGSVDLLTRLVMTNAVYFRGAWRSWFRERATARAAFYVNGETAYDVAMMNQVEEFRYAEASGVQVVELPYQGDGLSMLVVLPNERNGLSRVESVLTPKRLADWATGAEEKAVELSLPRFVLHATMKLKDTLRKLGVKLAFDSIRADFRGISSNRDLYLDEVYHQVFVTVTEWGTEATAASAVTVPIVAELGAQVRVVADHPFLFAIRHRASGALLFVGRVVAPPTAQDLGAQGHRAADAPGAP